jgi:hypothetical protein
MSLLTYNEINQLHDIIPQLKGISSSNIKNKINTLIKLNSIEMTKRQEERDYNKINDLLNNFKKALTQYNKEAILYDILCQKKFLNRQFERIQNKQKYNRSKEIMDPELNLLSKNINQQISDLQKKYKVQLGFVKNVNTSKYPNALPYGNNYKAFCDENNELNLQSLSSSKTNVNSLTFTNSVFKSHSNKTQSPYHSQSVRTLSPSHSQSKKTLPKPKRQRRTITIPQFSRLIPKQEQHERGLLFQRKK